MSCVVCTKRMRFIAQVSAPADDDEVGHSHAFHRMLYVFACASAACVRSGSVRVLRCQLPRMNDHYASDLDQRSAAPAELPAHPCFAQARRWCSVCGFSAGGGATSPALPPPADRSHILAPLVTNAFAKVQQGGTPPPQAPKAVLEQLLQWMGSDACPAVACCGECSTVLASWLLTRALACAALVADGPTTAVDGPTRADSLAAAVTKVLSLWAACSYSEGVYMPLAPLVRLGVVYAEHAMYTDAEPSLQERLSAIKARDESLVARHAKLWNGGSAGGSAGGAAAAAGQEAGAAQEEDMDISDTTQAELLAASGGTLAADLEMRAFKQRVAHVPGQVLRFCRWAGAEPLWLGSAGKPQPGAEGVSPPCTCGAPRDFEFQIMPQVLDALQVPPRLGAGGSHDELDFGTIAVYTCTRSCQTEPSASEWAHTQAAETHVAQIVSS